MSRARDRVWRLGILASLALLSAGANAQTPPQRDNWSENEGVEIARRLIKACVEASGTDSLSCVRRPYKSCESEHGIMSTHDMGDCARFSLTAWRTELAYEADKLNKVLPATSRGEFQRLQSTWNAWLETDCNLRVSYAEGGTLHSLAKAMCLIENVGERTIALRGSTKDWGG